MKSSIGGRLIALACVLALVAGALPALAVARSEGASSSRAAKLPKAPSIEGSLKVKPTSMQIIAVGPVGGAPKLPTIIGGKQSGNHSGPLQWKTWNKTKAVAAAYIYEGTRDGYPSTVTLTHPRSIDGQLVFTQLKSDGGNGLTAKISHQSGPGGSVLQWAPPGT